MNCHSAYLLRRIFTDKQTCLVTWLYIIPIGLCDGIPRILKMDPETRAWLIHYQAGRGI